VCGCLETRTYTDGYGLPCPVERDAEGLLNFGCVEVSACPFCGERLWIGDSGDIEVIALKGQPLWTMDAGKCIVTPDFTYASCMLAKQ
jgi:hypothetical protein